MIKFAFAFAFERICFMKFAFDMRVKGLSHKLNHKSWRSSYESSHN